MGVLYSVALPIGNLRDITLRALEILKQVDFIACEDTRNTQNLLNKFEIKSKLIDCHKFNEKERIQKISALLGENGKGAMVSDAGTPNICDPGSVLIKGLSAKGHKIIPIPGCCAIAAFLSAIPRENEFFTFIGFMPRTKSQREKIFSDFNNINCIFYESPKRLMGLLSDIKDFFGENRKIAVARELTKIFEEIKINTVGEIIRYFEEHTLKGEFVGMIFADEKNNQDDLSLEKDIKILKEQGFSDKDTAKILSSLKDIPKNKVYEKVLMKDKN